MAFTNADSIKQRISEDLDGTVFDDIVDDLIAGAEGQIETYLNRTVESGTHTDIFTETASKFYLTNYPVSEVKSVKLINRRDKTETAQDYYVSGDKRSVITDGVTVEPPCELEIIYVGGYAAVPAPIKEACELLVIRAFQRRRNEGMSRINVNQNEIWFNEVFDDGIREMLNPYKNVSIV